MKTALVLGAGGFIGGHMVNRLKSEGFWVRGVDLLYPAFGETRADEFVIGDLREQHVTNPLFDRQFDEVYQFAADMGGAGYLFTGENDADIMHNSAIINLNIVKCAKDRGVNNVFYSSSACVYPERNQEDPNNPICSEDSVYPADPDSEYGWEKLFSERMYSNFNRQHGMNCKVARFHNIFGPFGAWRGGKEKAPAAICRKVAEANDGTNIEIWGDGLQTRSFLYVDECIEGSIKLMRSDFSGPVNVGSKEMISINDLAKMVIEISGKSLSLSNITGPEGVRGRTSDNRLIFEKLNWQPGASLRTGMEKTYEWIARQVEAATAELPNN
ncbi:NAD-dependent epimerase/dehydratase family protein [Parasedimentitalea psychrophila]|uniref:NAD-dependent epimerase/dehydratase family protein n=1 Tax=Parasedimentitalea psychrophila TaxID=2997337 RepID=A0A9Y2P5K4_9RHOB|nr:NAD-dependent epimerase/dehydratase family protein [Parasedimentitalea psychrophila]WIY23685.1 NAD-dependent epimerase/dehydratase family protein [Parasedimentitalea psychrophila]